MFILLLGILIYTLESSATTLRCKLLPGDATWPSKSIWDAFNASVDGRLIRTVPIGSPCHTPNFNPEQCEIVRNNWHETGFQ